MNFEKTHIDFIIEIVGIESFCLHVLGTKRQEAVVFLMELLSNGKEVNPMHMEIAQDLLSTDIEPIESLMHKL
tara:strand:+ start:831 stop:1049 length:219 start_codon:yes stop_codon:yes gene_type:complete